MKIKKIQLKKSNYYALIIDNNELIFLNIDEIKDFLIKFDYDTKMINELCRGL